MLKFRNKKTTVDGITFDSRKEAERYRELQLMERAGKISGLRRQVPFELIPAQHERFARYSKTGRRLKDGIRCIEKKCVYIADLVYEQDGETVVEDVKSKATKTPEYVIKRKLMLERFGIRIREV